MIKTLAALISRLYRLMNKIIIIIIIKKFFFFPKNAHQHLVSELHNVPPPGRFCYLAASWLAKKKKKDVFTFYLENK